MNELTLPSLDLFLPPPRKHRYFACFEGGKNLEAQKEKKTECPHLRKKKKGFYKTLQGKKVQRYLCLDCGGKPSEATSHLLYRAKKPWLARELYVCLNANTTLRRASLMLGCTRKTLARYLKLTAEACENELTRDLDALQGSLKNVQLDDMESSVHTKLRPVSMTLGVAADSRKILGFAVSEMPAKGRLAKKSREKYGKRTDQRRPALDFVLDNIKRLCTTSPLITTDLCPRYPRPIKRHLPDAVHKTTKGRRGCVVGQGELKRGGRDPLFALNHTCAMLRATISRLFRRTWNTTKKPGRLLYHMIIYCHFHNFVLIHRPSTTY